ncbi:Dps family protein, partial [Streptomyces sp. NPDC057757]|uniref:Dps family protein n=1 Tax=Streptomyces sp. NPDC057757 TaxID=3346241 RepID=UPI00368E7960
MMSKSASPKYTVPGLSTHDGGVIIDLLRMRLHALNDLSLTLKHVHWNVVGPHFIAVHEMLDPQVDRVREMADDTAERISALGGVPKGTPGVLVAERTWDDYGVARADA